MFLPTKYEDLSISTIVVGAEILKLLKKEEYNVESLFNEIRATISTSHQSDSDSITLNQYYNTLTFLWIIEAIESDGFFLKIK